MLSPELREKVLEYINDGISLNELRLWYAPKLPHFLRDPKSSEAHLIGAIELAHSEMQDELRTEEDVRTFIESVLRNHNTSRLSVNEPNITATSGSSNTVSREVAIWPSRTERPKVTY